MLAGGLIVLGIVFLAIVVVAGFAFARSGQISRQENVVYYDELVERLQKLHNRNAANDAAEHQETPVRLVRP